MQLDIDRELEICERATPGPWHVGGGRDGSHFGIYDENCCCVALAWRGENPATTEAEHRANAALISFAPEALRRLKRVRELLFEGRELFLDGEYNFTKEAMAELRELLGVK